MTNPPLVSVDFTLQQAAKHLCLPTQALWLRTRGGWHHPVDIHPCPSPLTAPSTVHHKPTRRPASRIRCVEQNLCKREADLCA